MRLPQPPVAKSSIDEPETASARTLLADDFLARVVAPEGRVCRGADEPYRSPHQARGTPGSSQNRRCWHTRPVVRAGIARLLHGRCLTAFPRPVAEDTLRAVVREHGCGAKPVADADGACALATRSVRGAQVRGGTGLGVVSDHPRGAAGNSVGASPVLLARVVG